MDLAPSQPQPDPLHFFRVRTQNSGMVFADLKNDFVFELQEPRMPMHSRFSMAEETTGNRRLLQIQYAFLELPKVPKEKPAGGAALWAWLFVNATKLDKVPDDLPQGPFREAMELAKEASFSVVELEAYHKVLDEIQQARDYGEEKEAAGRAEGHKSGLAEGHKSGLAEGKRDALIRLVTRMKVELSDEDRARIAECNDAPTLDRWFGNTLGAKTPADVLA